MDGDELSVAKKEGQSSDSLGLSVKPVEKDQLRTLKLRGGVLVVEVLPDSPSAVAGIKAGDILVQLGYSRIDDLDEYLQVIEELPESTPIAIRFYRQGRAIFRTIQID